MVSRIWSWINERWPVSAVVRWSLEEEIEGGSSFMYTLGSALLGVFLLQVATGIIQLFFYVPYVESAYNSVSFLRTQVPFGWLVNQIHRHGADVMVVLVALHLTRVFIFGGYKRPRELTWLIGVGLLVAVMALTFTGGPLPWDQKGYWEAEVGSNIPGSIPYIGGKSAISCGAEGAWASLRSPDCSEYMSEFYPHCLPASSSCILSHSAGSAL